MSIDLHILFDRAKRQIALDPQNQLTLDWLKGDDAGIGAVMGGLAGETPVMTEALLEKIGAELARRAAEWSGGHVHVRIGTGKVVTSDDLRKAALLADARRMLLRN